MAERAHWSGLKGKTIESMGLVLSSSISNGTSSPSLQSFTLTSDTSSITVSQMSSVMHNARIDRLDRAKSVNSRTNRTPSLPLRLDSSKKSGLVECEEKEGNRSDGILIIEVVVDGDSSVHTSWSMTVTIAGHHSNTNTNLSSTQRP